MIHDLRRQPEIDAPNLRAHGVVSGAIVMIGPAEAPVGRLGAFTTTARRFSAYDLDFLSGIASILSAALAVRDTQERLRHGALHDALTGLPNRALLLDRLTTALARSGRAEGPIALFTLDIDRLKQVNDMLGHHAGDALLRALGPRLRTVLRPSDTIGRYSGDAFTVICDEVDGPDGAFVIAERLMEALAEPFPLPGGLRAITCSIGVVVVETGAGRDPQQLLADAEAAMFRAQQRGRNRVEIFDSEDRRRTLALGALEDDLRRALAAGDELWVAYQPIHALRDGRLVAVEALARWEHPLRGPVSPAEFIPVAEDSEQIVALGTFVLRTACAELARLRELPGGTGLHMSVNASAVQLATGRFPALVADVLAEHGLPGDALAIEITEGMLLDRSPATAEALDALRALGADVMLDDFGTGYSSLSYLRRYPLSGLKIDRAFVTDLGTDGLGDSALVEAIVGMARALQLTTVPEGIETAAQLARLGELGCDLAQGFHLSRPLSADALAALVGE